MRKFLLAAALASALPGAANAVQVTYDPGFGFPALVTPTIFQNFGTGGVTPSAYTGGTGSVQSGVTYTETVSGSSTLNSGSVPGQAVDPDGSGNGNFLAVENGSYTVAFSTPLQFFSFVFGSLDSYNTLTIFSSAFSGGSLTLAGTQILTGNPLASVGPTNSTTNGRVSIDMQGAAGITSVVFGSARQAFEIDGLAGAVPEPATWGMMILGFGAAGAALRLRRRKQVLATA